MFSPFFENYRAQVIMADCEPVLSSESADVLL